MSVLSIQTSWGAWPRKGEEKRGKANPDVEYGIAYVEQKRIA